MRKINSNFNIIVGAQLDKTSMSAIRKQLKDAFREQYNIDVNPRHIVKSLNQIADAEGKISQTFGSVVHDGKAYDFTLGENGKLIGQLREEAYSCASAIKLLDGAFAKLRTIPVGSVDFNKMVVEAADAAKEIERRFGANVASAASAKTGLDISQIYQMADAVRKVGFEGIDLSKIFSGLSSDVKHVGDTSRNVAGEVRGELGGAANDVGASFDSMRKKTDSSLDAIGDSADEAATSIRNLLRLSDGRVVSSNIGSVNAADIDRIISIANKQIGEGYSLKKIEASHVIDNDEIRGITGSLMYYNEQQRTRIQYGFDAIRVSEEEAAALHDEANAVIDVSDGLYRLSMAQKNVSWSAAGESAKKIFDAAGQQRLAYEKIRKLEAEINKLDYLKQDPKMKGYVSELNALASNIVGIDSLDKFNITLKTAGVELQTIKTIVSHTLDPLASMSNKIRNMPSELSNVRTEFSKVLNPTEEMQLLLSDIERRVDIISRGFTTISGNPMPGFTTPKAQVEEIKSVYESIRSLSKMTVAAKKEEAGLRSAINTVNRYKKSLNDAFNASAITESKTPEAYANMRSALDSIEKEMDDIIAKGKALTAEEKSGIEQRVAAYKKYLSVIGSVSNNGYHSTLFEQGSYLAGKISNKDTSLQLRSLVDQYNEAWGRVSSSNYSYESVMQYSAIREELERLIRTTNSYNAAQKRSFTDGNSTRNRNLNTLTQYEKKLRRILSYYDKYRSSITRNGPLNANFEEVIGRLRSSSFASANEAEAAITNLMAATRRAGAEVETTGSKIAKLFRQHFAVGVATTGLMYLRTALTKIVTSVKEVNKAMIELQKVSGATSSQMARYLDSAKDSAVALGASISDVVSATAGFARLGYDLQDASKLGDIATMFYKVGDDMDSVEDATQAMVSVMAAFNIAVEDAASIPDKLNEVGNNFAISSGGLAESLKRSASALQVAGNTLDESVALITAANEVVQDPDSVGTTLKTLSLRLQGATTDLAEAGLDTDTMAISTAKLRKEILALSNVDIMIDDSTFKSTYDILREISAVWDDLTNIQQASVLELIAGKRNANVAASILNNFDTAERALKDSLSSAGSAAKEHDRWLTGVEAKQARFEANFQAFSNSIMGSDIVGGVYDAGSGILGFFTGMADVLGTIPTLAGAAGAALSFANAGFLKINKSAYALGDRLVIGKRSLNDRITDAKNASGLFGKIGAAAFYTPKQVPIAYDSPLGDGFINKFHDFRAAALGGTESLSSFNEQLAKTSNRGTRDFFANLRMVQGAPGEKPKWYFGDRELKSSKDAFDAYNASMREANKGVGIINSIGNAFLGLGRIVGNVFVNIVVSWAVNEFIQLITSAERAMEAAADSAKELSSNLDSLDDYESRLSDINEKLSQSNISEQEKYELKSDILEIQNELVDKYGAELKGVDLVNASLTRQKDILDEIARGQEAVWISKNRDAIDAAIEFMESDTAKVVIDQSSYYDPDDIYGSLGGGLGARYNSVFRMFEDFIGAGLGDFGIFERKSLTGSASSYGVVGTISEQIQQWSVFAETVLENYEEFNSWVDEKIENSSDKAKKWYGNVDFSKRLQSYIGDILNDLQDDDYTQNKSVYEQYIQAEIRTNQDYSNKSNFIEGIREQLSAAIVAENDDAIKDLYNQYTEGIGDIEDLINNSDIRPGIRNWFSDARDELDLLFREYEFETALNDQNTGLRDRLGRTLSNMRNGGMLDDLSVRAAYDANDVSLAKKWANELEEIAKQYGYTYDEFVDVLVKLGEIETREKAIQDNFKSFEDALAPVTKAKDMLEQAHSDLDENDNIGFSDEFLASLSEGASAELAGIIASYKQGAVGFEAILDYLNSAYDESVEAYNESVAKLLNIPVEQVEEFYDVDIMRLDLATASLGNALEEMTRVVTSGDGLVSAIKEVNKGNELTFETVYALQQAYPELADEVVKTATGYTISEEALRALYKAQIVEEQVALRAQIEKAKATIASTDVIVDSYENQVLAISSLVEAEEALASLSKNTKIKIGNANVYASELTVKNGDLWYGNFNVSENMREVGGDVDALMSQYYNAVGQNSEYGKVKESLEEIRKAFQSLESIDIDNLTETDWDAILGVGDYGDEDIGSKVDEEFDKAYQALQRQRDRFENGMPNVYESALQGFDAADGISSLKEYFDILEQLVTQFYADNAEKSHEHMLEILSGRNEIEQDKISDMEHQIELLKNANGSSAEIIRIYKEMQAALHALAEDARARGLDDNSEFIQGLQNQWWSYQKEIESVCDSQFDAVYQALQRQRDRFENGMPPVFEEALKEFGAADGIESVEQYFEILRNIVKKFYSDNDEKAHDYLSEIISGERDVAQDKISDMEHQIELLKNARDAAMSGVDDDDPNAFALKNAKDNSSEIIRMYKEMQDYLHELAEKARADGLDENSDYIQGLQKQWWSYQKEIESIKDSVFENWESAQEDALNYQKSALDEIIDLTVEMIKQEKQDIVDGLEEQVDNYTEIIRLKKESLSLSKREKDHNEAVSEINSDLAEMEARLAALSLDDSREAEIEKNRLREEMAKKQKELTDLQYDYSVTNQEDALDKELDAFTKTKQDEIDELRDYISDGKQLVRDAIARIQEDIDNGTDTTLQGLLTWNETYGNSLTKNIVDKWAETVRLAKEYGSVVGADEELSKKEYDYNNEKPSYGGSVYSDEEQSSIKKMYANSQKWHTASTEERTALQEENAKIASDHGWTYDSESGKWYDQYNKWIYSDLPSVSAEKDKAIETMYQNSKAWKDATEEERADLHKKNQEIAKQNGFRYDPATGKWYDRSGNWIYEKLPKYHTGGVVGGSSTLKQNELLAVLEKKEIVLDAAKQDRLMELIFGNGVFESVFPKAGRAVDLIDDSRRSVAEITINAPLEVHGDMDDKMKKFVQKYPRLIANEVAKVLSK